MLDVIQQGRWTRSINTVTGQRGPLQDGFEIRRAAAERRIPCFTSLDTLRAAVWATAAEQRARYGARPLAEYLAGRLPSSRSSRASADGSS